MKRTRIQRKTWLRQKTPLRKVNRERMHKKRHDETGFKHTYGPYHSWMGTKPCAFLFRGNHRCFRSVAGHHLVLVGQGGQDYANQIPVCEGIHTEIHSSTAADIELRYGLSKRGMELEAKRWAKEWDKNHDS